MHTEKHLVGAFENDVGAGVIVLWRGATIGRHFAGTTKGGSLVERSFAGIRVPRWMLRVLGHGVVDRVL